MSKLKFFLKENIIYILILLITFLVFYVELPFYIMAPGGIIDISDRVIVKNKNTLNGKLNMLYASEIKATIPTYLIASLNSKWDAFKNEERQISNENMEEITLRNKILLDNSIDTAIYAAYEELGKELEIIDIKNYIIGKLPEAKCDVKIGDIITKVDTINALEVNIQKYVVSKNVGDKILLEVVNNKKKDVKTCEVINIDNLKKLGIVYSQDYEYKLDDDIKIEFKASEGGSSGGFMMALSIYLSMHDEDLLKNRIVAGTGTIDVDGNVGEIGGVKYKIIGAHENGIELIFVPTNNYDEAMSVAKEYKYKMKIIKIDNLHEAIEYLRGE